MQELLGLDLESQARHWGQHRRRWREGSWVKAEEHTRRAHQRLGSQPCSEYLFSQGFTVDFLAQDHRLGPVRFRARLSLPERALVVYESALKEVAAGLERLGGNPQLARELVLSHEAFHVLCPECPEGLAELAAHRFASEHLKLEFFAGLVDLA